MTFISPIRCGVDGGIYSRRESAGLYIDVAHMAYRLLLPAGPKG